MSSTINDRGVPHASEAPAAPGEAAIEPAASASHRRHLPSAVVPALVLAATVVATAGFTTSAALATLHSRQSALGDLDAGAIILCALGFFSGSLAYQLARLGWKQRSRVAQSALSSDLDPLFEGDRGDLVILVPSYKEEARVVRRTLLSAALQQYPGRRVVLLIDDPPAPSDPADETLLTAARSLPCDISALLLPAAETAQSAATSARAQLNAGGSAHQAAAVLAGGHRRVADWLEELAERWEVIDHEDTLFVDRCVRGLARINVGYAVELERGRLAQAHPEALRLACRRLTGQLTVSIESFERKRYVNTNHEPNKAMNLNMYLSLLGRSVVEEPGADGFRLRIAEPGEHGTLVPEAAFALTLDADSVLLPDYSLTLLHQLQAPGNERLAVAQTPYSAIPGAPGAIERAAGATTDIQHLIHQGFTRFGATFWVGANAMLRVEALREIAKPEPIGDLPVARFIQDRTVIEDTESSIDLRAAGWQLYNHPERLAYSATPPDFGSLLIQRRRWANGGLLIVPKLLRHLRSSSDRLARRSTEGFLRLHYLTSIAWVNVALITVFVLPYRPVSPLLWLAAGSVPYFAAYARDLRASGYRVADLVSVYALNLVLVPVNLGGVVKSVYQGVTGRKTPFARTPKIDDRTPSPPLYIVLELVALAYLVAAALFDLLSHQWLHALVDAANLALLTYGMAWLVGVPAVRDSLRVALEALQRIRPAYSTGGTSGGSDL